MQVFGFDLMAYPERLDHLKVGTELPYPLPKQHFRPDVAVRNYREHLEAWALMEELGFDGIGFNEHHTSPYGLMTSPNLMAAAISQRTSRMKVLIMGNLLPIHEPLRVAEKLAMVDCLTNGRLISGFARGIPREYLAYHVDRADSLGANTLLLNFNQGALPHELFVQNLQRFAKEVLPALKAHEVITVPVN